MINDGGTVMIHDISSLAKKFTKTSQLKHPQKLPEGDVNLNTNYICDYNCN